MGTVFTIPQIPDDLWKAVSDLRTAFPLNHPSGAVTSDAEKARDFLISVINRNDPTANENAVTQLGAIIFDYPRPILEGAPLMRHFNRPLAEFLGIPVRDAVLAFIDDHTKPSSLRLRATLEVLPYLLSKTDADAEGSRLYDIFVRTPRDAESSTLRYAIFSRAAQRGQPFAQLEAKCLALLGLFSDSYPAHSAESEDLEIVAGFDEGEGPAQFRFIDIPTFSDAQKFIINAATSLAARSAPLQSALTSLALTTSNPFLRREIVNGQAQEEIPWQLAKELVLGLMQSPLPATEEQEEKAFNLDTQGLYRRFFILQEPEFLSALEQHRMDLEQRQLSVLEKTDTRSTQTRERIEERLRRIEYVKQPD